MSSTKERIREALFAMGQAGKRDLGFHVFMIIFCLVGAAIAIPIILLLTYLPDWACYPLGGALLIWLLFGDTLAAGYRAFRSGQP